MANFEYSAVIPASKDKVFEFSCDLNNLISVLPPSYKAQLLSPDVKLDLGKEFELRVSRYGVSMVWGGVIEEFEKDTLFVDRQTVGPFSLWVHRHQFEDHASGTLVTDLVEYDLPLGILGKLADDLLARHELKKFFEHRNRMTCDFFLKTSPKNS